MSVVGLKKEVQDTALYGALEYRVRMERVY